MDWREAVLALEDGSVFVGQSFGAEVDTDAEVVFNTSITGYQEVATDPSYRGQMVVMTQPQIGNYGVAASGDESVRPWVAALIVRELAEHPNHWEAQDQLQDFLARWNVPGLQGIDTRAVVRRLRETGTQRGVLRHSGPGGFTPSDLGRMTEAAQRAPSVSQLELVSEVSAVLPSDRGAGEIAVLDCGAKWNIVRSFERRGVGARIFPWDASAEDILAGMPKAVVLSNGPGDPAKLPTVVEQVRRLVTSGTPVLGICLGHQLLGLAAGATTSRLPYGHHGGNHPVRDLLSGRVTITTQNHEFQVVRDTLPAASGFEVSHINLNDGSVEGLRHREYPVFSVQYHPEGCPGPQDSQGLFDALLRSAGIGDWGLGTGEVGPAPTPNPQPPAPGARSAP